MIPNNDREEDSEASVQRNFTANDLEAKNSTLDQPEAQPVKHRKRTLSDGSPPVNITKKLRARAMEATGLERADTCCRCKKAIKGVLLRCKQCRRSFHLSCRSNDESERESLLVMARLHKFTSLSRTVDPRVHVVFRDPPRAQQRESIASVNPGVFFG